MVKLHLLKGHSRIWVRAIINGVQDIDVMVDTGCHTTMIDEELADRYGEPLPDRTVLNIMGKSIDVKAYRLKSISFDGFAIENVFVWSAPFETGNELHRKLLLGLNIMNNWDYRINRNKNIMEIKEDIFLRIPESDHPYMHCFKDGKYMQLMEEGNQNR